MRRGCGGHRAGLQRGEQVGEVRPVSVTAVLLFVIRAGRRRDSRSVAHRVVDPQAGFHHERTGHLVIDVAARFAADGASDEAGMMACCYLVFAVATLEAALTFRAPS